MPTDVAHEKQQVHELIDRLAPSQVAAVRCLLEAMVESRTSEDDDPVTEEDRIRFRTGKAWLAERGGKGIPMDQVLAEFGLKPEDFPTSSNIVR
jgi:hypothetical protein